MSKAWTRIEDYNRLVLCRGLGKDPESGLCVMQTAAWLVGEPLTDHPACASHVLAEFAIFVNDELEQAPRQQLRKLAVLLSGSRAPDFEMQRAEFLIVQVAKDILAPFLRDEKKLVARFSADPSCAQVDKELCMLPMPHAIGRRGLGRRSKLELAIGHLLRAAEHFETARKTGNNPEAVGKAVSHAAVAGVTLNPEGGKLALILERAIRLADGPASGAIGGQMTGKGQAARCSAKGTLPCPNPSSQGPTPELVLAGFGSSTGAGG